jgi:hypothetical protein
LDARDTDRGLNPAFHGRCRDSLFFATAIGIFLGTLARSMPQLGVLFMLVYLPINMLSQQYAP